MWLYYYLSRVDKTLWEGPPLKKSGSHIFYQKTHFIAFLDSSHQAGSICCFKFLLNPKFDQVMVLSRKLTSVDQIGALESIWALALPNETL